MSARDWVYLAAGTMALSGAIIFGILFLKYRAKFSLVRLLLSLFILAGIVYNHFDRSVVSTILIDAAIIASLVVLIYPQLGKFLGKDSRR